MISHLENRPRCLSLATLLEKLLSRYDLVAALRDKEAGV